MVTLRCKIRIGILCNKTNIPDITACAAKLMWVERDCSSQTEGIGGGHESYCSGDRRQTKTAKVGYQCSSHIT